MPRLNQIQYVLLSILPALLFALVTLCSLAPAQEITRQLANSERHTTSDPGSALYQRSAFAHGFIHGYERGFHLADLDYHVARLDRRPEQTRAYRDAAGYRTYFGDKKIFERGYREGFLLGYDDSIHCRHFRAETAASAVAASLKDYAGSTKELDAGFAAGFAAVRSNPQNVPACQQSQDSAYCSGFALGAEFAEISSGASPVIAKAKLATVAVK